MVVDHVGIFHLRLIRCIFVIIGIGGKDGICVLLHWDTFYLLIF